MLSGDKDARPLTLLRIFVLGNLLIDASHTGNCCPSDVTMQPILFREVQGTNHFWERSEVVV